jgi:16S rRNA (cytosine967-C5)-methyltransferase
LSRAIAYNKDIALLKAIQAPSARQTALQILHAIDTQQAYTDVVLRQTLRQSPLDRRARAFITECVYGVVRWQGRLDWLLAQICRRPLADLTPWIRNALRLGGYQCLWMTGVPHRAAVYETVELARRFGHQGTARLVNGVLRTLVRQHQAYPLPDALTQPAAHLAVAFSHPQWLVARWLARYGWERTRALCEANNQPAGVTLRTNTLRTTPTALMQRLHQEGLRHVILSSLVPEGLIAQGTDRLDALPSYHEGLFQVQDEGALLVAPLCQVQPGQWVLDACAAPGGKTTHLAHLMGDTGHLLACDVQPGRLRLLRDNVRRAGLSCITTVVADATRALPLRQAFDRILVDAPCSGLGVLRRRPDIKWRKGPADLVTLQALQRALLHNLHERLAADGLLVYSVCSNEPEETHEVVAHFLAAHPHMRLVAIDEALLQRLPVSSATSGTLDLTPEQWHTDGVFVACFRRQGVGS